MICSPNRQEPKKIGHDPVNQPDHYTSGGIEVIDFIEAKRLCFHRANAVKYIARADLKENAIQDIKKAVWYLNRYLKLHDKGGKA